MELLASAQKIESTRAAQLCSVGCSARLSKKKKKQEVLPSLSPSAINLTKNVIYSSFLTARPFKFVHNHTARPEKTRYGWEMRTQPSIRDRDREVITWEEAALDLRRPFAIISYRLGSGSADLLTSLHGFLEVGTGEEPRKQHARGTSSGWCRTTGTWRDGIFIPSISVAAEIAGPMDKRPSWNRTRVRAYTTNLPWNRACVFGHC